MPSKLVVIAGPDKGRVFPISANTTLVLGRGKTTQTQLADPHVSRSHCEVCVEGDRVLAKDSQSVAGTFVNGQRITNQPLRDGDVIRVGETELRFESTLPPPAAPAKDIVFANRPGGRNIPKPLRDLEALAGKDLGNYHLMRVLGAGQIGMVFQARDLKDQKSVALKVLTPEFARDPKAVLRFVRGMKAARSLSHPNLVTIYSAGVAKPHCWVAMEMVDGVNLAEEIRKGQGKQLDWKRCWQLAVHVCRGLDYLHQRGLIHRNVMPSNVMIGRDRVAKLGDVTLAKALEGGTPSQDVSASGEMVGNVFYMAPERTQSKAEVDGRADLYGLGVTLYLLLTGRLPFQGSSLIELAQKIRLAQPDRPGKFQPAIPTPFEAMVLRMLAKKPEERHATAGELLGDLERFGQGQDLKA